MKAVVERRLGDEAVIARWRCDIDEVESLLLRSEKRIVIGIDTSKRDEPAGERAPRLADVCDRNKLKRTATLHRGEIRGQVPFLRNEAKANHGGSKRMHGPHDVRSQP